MADMAYWRLPPDEVPSDGGKHHFSLIYNKGSWSCYVDGELVASTP